MDSPPVSCCGARRMSLATVRRRPSPTAATRSGRCIRHRRRSHCSPSRTQKLSSCAPTILGGRLPGKIGNANTESQEKSWLSFLFMFLGTEDGPSVSCDATQPLVLRWCSSLPLCNYYDKKLLKMLNLHSLPIFDGIVDFFYVLRYTNQVVKNKTNYKRRKSECLSF